MKAIKGGRRESDWRKMAERVREKKKTERESISSYVIMSH